jgi:hypothetical protein
MNNSSRLSGRGPGWLWSVLGLGLTFFALAPGRLEADPATHLQQRINALHQTARRGIARSMERAAAKAGISIATEEIVLGSRSDVLLIATRAPDQRGPRGFVYFSFPTFACAQTLPQGFYTVEPVVFSSGEQLTIFRNLEGQIVARLPRFESSRAPGSPPISIATSSTVGGEDDTPCVDIKGVGTTYFNLADLT